MSDKTKIEVFIEENTYKIQIHQAVSQEDRIAFFVQTQLQDSLYYQPAEAIDRIWNTSNSFMVWMQSWMRKDNFDAFMKYIRNPLPTTTLIQDDIIPELMKVLEAQNQYFQYHFSSMARQNDANQFLKEKYPCYYKDVIFDALINKHNSIVVTDYIKTTDPYRLLINIRDVMAIEPDADGNIKAIVFKGIDSEQNERLFYYTDEFYSIYTKDNELISEDPHTLGECPADFISQKPLNSKQFVVRKSIFSNFIEKMENYVNYYVLQKMFIPHGALPVTTYYRENNKACKASFKDGSMCKDGYLVDSQGLFGSRDKKKPCPICNDNSLITAGSVIKLKVPQYTKEGQKPFDLNANFVKFHHAPVSILEWFDKFVAQKRNEIRTELVGRGLETDEAQAKNVEQVRQGNRTLENTLLYFSNQLSTLRARLDSKILRVKFGSSYQGCNISFGSEFYLEKEPELRKMRNEATDPIAKDGLDERINYTVNKNNPERLLRDNILRKLLPYSTLTDAEIDKEEVDIADYELRRNFPYYIDSFEAEYTNIVLFVKQSFPENTKMSVRLDTVKNILYDMVKEKFKTAEQRAKNAETNT